MLYLKFTLNSIMLYISVFKFFFSLSAGQAGTHYVGQAGFKVTVVLSQVLGYKSA